MNTARGLILFGIALGLLFSVPTAGAGQQKNILLLHAYHQGYKWTDDLTRGALAGLDPVKSEVKVYIEYMGTKWSNDKAYFEKLSDIYRHKFQTIRFDVIIATDNDAFNFLTQHRDKLFPNAPLVFCGVNWFNPASVPSGFTGYTGVNEDADIHMTVELMGGRIWVESEMGKGSEFHFTMLMGLQKDRAARHIPEKLENLQDLPVLVVDDNATNRRILEEMLKNWQMNPVCVDNGASALELLSAARQQGTPFRLMLLDVNMPTMDGFELAKRIQANPDNVDLVRMILTSSGQRGDAARCRELGISAYLTKPVKQSSLLDAIMTILGKTEPSDARPPLVTQHVLREKQQRALRILLAEDNAVNQKIASSMLTKRGHTVVVAGNGKEVLADLEAQGGALFDLILMDVQMPEMDGLETTGWIRAKEKIRGGHIPIIALTAHAMQGDRETCLNAGMDGYVSKPLKSEELFKTIDALFSA